VAKKVRTPPPPRKVQAPQRRHDPRSPLLDRNRLYILLGITGVAAVAVAIGLAVALTKGGGGHSDAKTLALMRAAGCTTSVTKASPPSQHIRTANQHVDYDTFPPVSGFHNPTPAIWGNYSQPVDPRQAVHNEEHGGIVIWYGAGISAATRDEITKFYEESPNGMLVTPLATSDPNVRYPKHRPLGSRVALTAWVTPANDPLAGQDVIAICPGFDEKAFKAFRDTFRGRGPERVPVSSNRPGT
jgi:hypothetical protein